MTKDSAKTNRRNGEPDLNLDGKKKFLIDTPPFTAGNFINLEP
jgi:hypothetical protein